jgi:hypothetical protein
MFRKTMIALAATAAVTGAVAGTAEAKKKKNFNFDIDINFGDGGFYPGGGFYDDDYDYCGWKWIKKKVWVKVAPGVFVKKKIWKKVNTCWY